VNVYYSPSEFGLELVGELEDNQACYDFDTLIFLRDVKTGAIYSARDAGCSCPTPFEDFFYRGENDTNLERVATFNDGAVLIAEYARAVVDGAKDSLRANLKSAFENILKEDAGA
jgi:hypothetical protein